LKVGSVAKEMSPTHWKVINRRLETYYEVHPLLEPAAQEGT
jgi:hypothetical protein